MTTVPSMNNDPTRPSIFSALRRALVLAGGTLLLATSCNTPDYGNQDNIFVPGQPRYGYGSPQNRPTAANPGRPRIQTTDRAEDAVPDPDRKPERKPVRIKRDPRDTTVDVSPPDPKPERKDRSEASGDNKAEDDTPAESTPSKPEPKTETTPTESKPAVTREDLPYGQPVVGKKGFVYSPHAPDKGQVDVADIPAGTKVKCPYTDKVFRVP